MYSNSKTNIKNYSLTITVDFYLRIYKHRIVVTLKIAATKGMTAQNSCLQLTCVNTTAATDNIVLISVRQHRDEKLH